MPLLRSPCDLIGNEPAARVATQIARCRQAPSSIHPALNSDNGSYCPTRSEGEAKARFQREVRVKRVSGASFGDDRGHSDAAATHNRAASRLRGRQRGGGLPTAGSGRGLRLRSGHAGTLRLSAPRQARQGRGGFGSSSPRRASRSSRRSVWSGSGGRPGRSGIGAAAVAAARSRASTRRRTSGCWRKSTRPSVRCPGWPRA